MWGLFLGSAFKHSGDAGLPCDVVAEASNSEITLLTMGFELGDHPLTGTAA